ncbi:formate dehydrogenase accessory sulfurtransferase FdhD [Nocardioidaceae bacterium]|nr:formate dehydrogenase accessory sulfurtransferase FdhD [Nocardioidaceae bacterium]
MSRSSTPAGASAGRPPLAPSGRVSRARRPGPSTRVRVVEVVGDRVSRHEDRVIGEEPLEVRLAWPGRPAFRMLTTMRTPGHDFELAAGLCLHEGILLPQLIRGIAYCTEASLEPEEEFNVVTVDLLGPALREVRERYDGPTAGSAACGVCGTTSIGDALAPAACHDDSAGADWSDLRLDPGVLAALPDRLREAQSLFDRTGGVHAAGLFDADGEPLVVREDVGRHNAVDKVSGARILAGSPTAEPVLCLSGRIGFELVQKAVVAGVGAVVAVGAPTGLAVRLAQEAGLCLVGFARDERLVCYARSERLEL